MKLRVAYGATGWRQSMSRTAETLATLGYQGIEGYGLLDLLPEDEGLPWLLSKLNLGFVGSYFGSSLITLVSQDAELARFDQMCKRAAAFGGKKIVVGAGKLLPSREDGHWHQLIANIGRMSRIAEYAHVELCYQPHYGTLVYNETGIAKFAAETPSEVKLTLDTGHLLMADVSCVETFEKYWTRLGHIHLKDLDKNGAFCSLGAGRPQVIRDVLKLLVDRGWADWVTIELDSSPDAKEAAKRSLDFVRSVVS